MTHIIIKLAIKFENLDIDKKAIETGTSLLILY